MPDQNRPDLSLSPTRETYDAFQSAYDHFNWAIFGGKLPNCLITLQRRARTYGYFSKTRFRRADGQQSDEIGLNPAHFSKRSVPGILATLAHEMAHLWQANFGTPGRGRYHNKEWATKMKEIGLQPSNTGEEGGRETGDTMSHYIITRGLFERETTALIAKGFEIIWMENEHASAAGKNPNGDAGSPDKKSGKRIKYRCPACGLNAWAKHDAALVCGHDMKPMAPV